MKWKIVCCTGALLGSVLAFPIQAQNLSPWYLGLKTGWMELDAPGTEDATNLGLYGGYTLMEDTNGRFAIEAEYTRSISDGEVGRSGWDIETLAAYGAYRTAGPWFLKLKAGWADADLSAGSGGNRFSDSETDFSFGAGGGVQLSNKAAFELEYTVIEDDVNFFSIGYLTHF